MLLLSSIFFVIAVAIHLNNVFFPFLFLRPCVIYIKNTCHTQLYIVFIFDQQNVPNITVMMDFMTGNVIVFPHY